jgi:hypothetical protein
MTASLRHCRLLYRNLISKCQCLLYLLIKNLKLDKNCFIEVIKVNIRLDCGILQINIQRILIKEPAITKKRFLRFQLINKRIEIGKCHCSNSMTTGLIIFNDFCHTLVDMLLCCSSYFLPMLTKFFTICSSSPIRFSFS